MKLFDPISALAYGAIGLGFLLAFLSYGLLSSYMAQKNGEERSPNPIYAFMVFCILLVSGGIFLEIYRGQDRLAAINLQLLTSKAELDDVNARLGAAEARLSALPRLQATIASLEQSAIPAVSQCRQDAYGATTNTGHLAGCLAAAGKAMASGEAASAQLGVILSELKAIASQ